MTQLLRFTALCAAILFFGFVQAQTTYTWIGATGGSWATSTNWSPTRTTPAATDIIQFNDGGTYLVTAVPTQTIRQLLISDSTNVTLQSSGTTTLTINGPSNTDNLVIAQGSTLDYSTTNALTITMATTANQRADISGILNVRTGAFTTTGSGTNLFTVSSTGVVNHFSGTITGSAATLVFDSLSSYVYNSATALTVPTATWHFHSKVTFNGITTGIPAGLNQNFGNMLWDCGAQSTTINLGTFPITVNSFEFRNSNNQVVTHAASSNRVWTTAGAGDLLITGGRFAVRGGALNVSQSLTVRDLVIDNSNNANAQLILDFSSGVTTGLTIACVVSRDLTINLPQNATNANIIQFRAGVANTEQVTLSGNFTQTGTGTGAINRAGATGTQNFIFNGTTTYSAAKANIFGTLTVINLTGATVDFGTSILTYTGNFAINATGHAIFRTGGYLNNTGTFSTVAGSTLSIGDTDGITATGGGATGSVRSSSTRTYITSGNYHYIGTSPQITGTGLLATVSGILTINSTSTVTLTQATTLSNAAIALNLLQGRLLLGNNNLTLSSATSTIGGNTPSATNMIVTNGIGQLIKAFPASAYPFTFPVGDTVGTPEYSPTTLSFTTSSATRNIGVRVINAPHPNMGGVSNYLNRYWIFTNSAAGTYSYNLDFTYTNNDVVGSAALTLPSRWNGSAWIPYAGSVAGNQITFSGTLNQATLPISGTTEFTGREGQVFYYRSVQDGNWNTLATWEADTDPNFSAPSTPAAAPTSANSARIIISAGTKVTVSGAVTANDLDVYGTLESTVTNPFTFNGSFVFYNGSNYEHNFNGGAIPIPTRWDTTSTVRITGITNATALTNISGQSFGNWVHASVNQNSALPYAITGTATRFKGHFTIDTTGTGSISLKNATTGVTINIDSSLTINRGTLNANIAATTGLTLNVGNDFVVNDGTFNLSTAAIACALTIGGNYLQTGGLFTQTSTTGSLITFTGTSKTFTQSGGTHTNNNLNYRVESLASLTNNSVISLGNGSTAGRTFTVASNGTLTLGQNIITTGATASTGLQVSGTLICGSNIVGGTGLFNLASGATIHIGSPDGITLTPTTAGNIQNTGGTRTFNTAANYVYNGLAPQQTGTGLPTTVNSLTINNNATLASERNVALTSSITTVTSALTLNSGRLILGNNSITLPASATISGNTFSSDNMLVTNGTGELRKAFASSGFPLTFTYPIGDTTATTDYTPATLVFSANSVNNRTLGVRVIDTRHPQDVLTSDYLTRFWSVTSSSAAGTYTLDATFNYSAADVNGTESNLLLYQYNPSTTAWRSYTTSQNSNEIALNGTTNTDGFIQTSFDVTGRNASSYYYRSKQNGNWNDLATWEVSTTADFAVTANALVLPTAANSDTIMVSLGDTVTVTATPSPNPDDVVVNGVLNINSGITFAIANGASATDLIVNGTINNNNGTLTLNTTSSLTTVNGFINNIGASAATTGAAATLVFANGSQYDHNRNAGTIPTATWQSGSTCRLSGITNGMCGGLGQAFHHFTYSGNNHTQANNFAGLLTTVNGNFTYGNTTALELRLSGTVAYTLTVGGNFVVDSGTLSLISSTLVSGSAITTINGNLLINGGRFGGSGSTQVATVNLDGNYTQSGGTFDNIGSGVVTFNFRGANRTFQRTGGTFTPTNYNFNINTANASLRLLSDITVASTRSFTLTNGTLFCDTNKVVGAGTFTTNATTATLGIGHPDGINRVATGNIGNIQTATRTYGVSTNYLYNGTAAQLSGDAYQSTAFPATANVNSLTINNPAGVLLQTYVIATANLNLTDGILSLGNSDLVLLNTSNTTAIVGNTPSATNMVVTNGTGRLIKNFGTNSTVPFTWPLGDNVGTPEYTPPTITFASNATGYLGMQVTDAKHPSDFSTTDFLSRYWTASVASGLATHNYTFTAVHDDTVGNVANMKLNHYNNATFSWTENAGSTVTANTISSTTGITHTTFPLTNAAFTGRDNANVVAYYRSFQSGNWGDASTWEVSPDPAFTTPPPVAAGSPPTAGNSAGIIIQNGHNVTVAAAASGDQMTIEAGGTLTINASQTFTLADGTGTDLTVSGTVTNFGTLTATGSVVFDVNSAYNHSVSGGTIPTATWDAASTLTINAASLAANPTGFGQTFGNVVWNPTAQSATGTINANMAVNGDLQVLSGTFADGGFIITGTGSKTFSVASGATYTTTRSATPWYPTNMSISLDNNSTVNYNGNATFPLSGIPDTYGNLGFGVGGTKTLPAATPFNVNGNLTISAGTLADNGNTITVKGNVINSAAHSGTGKILLSGGTTAHAISGGTAAYGNLELDDTLGTTVTGTGTTTIGNLTITSGTMTVNALSLGLTVSGATTVSGTLNLSNATGSRLLGNVTINNGAAVNVTVAPASLTTANLIVNTGGTWNNSSNIAVSISGNLQNDGTFTSGNGTYSFTGTNRTISGANPISFVGMSINNGPYTMSTPVNVSGTFTVSNTLNNNSTLTVTSASTITGSGTIVNDLATSVFNVASSSITPTLTAIVAGNLVNYNSTTVAQTAKPTTYSNLTLNNTFGSPNTIGASTVNGTLTLQNGAWQIGTNTLTINRDLTVNTGSLTGGSTSNITIGANGSPANLTLPAIASNLNNLTINRANGVTLGAPLSLNTSGVLTLTNGLLTTTSTNTLTLLNTAVGAVSGGSAASYVNGPLTRTFPGNMTAAATYAFPVGKSAYQLFELINANTSAAGTVTLTVEAFDAATGGTNGLGIDLTAGVSKYWRTNFGGVGSFTNLGAVRLTDAGVNSTHVVGYSPTLTGPYNSYGGTLSGSTVASTMILPVTEGFYTLGGRDCIGNNVATTTYTVGPTGDLKKLTDVAGLLNASIICGNLIFELQPTYDGTSGEVFPITFNSLNYSGGPWSVIVRPAASVTTPLVTAGDPGSTNPLINWNGVDYLTFDGVPGGSTVSNVVNDGRWIIRNTRTATTVGPTVQLVNDATNDTLRYLQIEGQNITANSGTIVIGTTTGTTGNDQNTIVFNAICGRTDGTGTPVNGIYAQGTSSRANNNITIANNNIFNYWAAGVSNSGILVGANNHTWSILNNSFYQTASRNSTKTAIDYGIQIDNSTDGNNFTVYNNYIGGSEPLRAGTPWTVTGTSQVGFIGISANISTSGTMSVDSNFISNINITSSRTAGFPGNAFTGILSSSNGGVSLSKNTVGAPTGNGSITINNVTSTGALVVGIGHSNSSGEVNITNNKVGSFTVTSSGSFSVSFNGIRYGQGGSSSARTISGNLIGSLTTPNSINVNTGSNNATSQDVIGINMTGGANAVSITNNTIANLRNNRPTTGNSQTIGINSPFAPNTITGNTIRNLSSTANNTNTLANSAMFGILLTATSATGHNISNNTIHSLTTSSSSGIAVSLYGIYYNPATGGTNTINANNIHSIHTTSNSTTAIITGLYVASGSAAVTNNMIRLGVDTAGSSLTNPNIYYGIFDNSATNNYYHNSVYVGGSSVTGATNTFAFYSAVSSGTRAIQNNIFWNARSNGSGTGKHYAIRIGATTGLTCNYNDLFANGTGAVLGVNNTTDYTTLGAWQTGTLQDANSIAANPQFVSATGNAATVDLHIDINQSTPIESSGVIIPSVTVDYDGDDRATNTPTDIGADAGLFTGADLTAPSISYTSISNVCNTETSVSLTATITDNSGVNVTPGTKPRLYFKKSTDANTLAGWQYVEASNAASPFNFSFNFSALGGLTAGETVQYFVVAQDEGPLVITPNVAINSGVFAAIPGSVDLTATEFPISGTINQFEVLPCQGTITVGTGGNYPAFTTATGFFRAINLATVTGNLTINVVSDISIEDGTHALNEFASPFTLTIQPDVATLRTISGTYNGAGIATNGLFRFNGADRVFINGGSNNDRNLLFRNLSTGAQASTFMLVNDAQRNRIFNAIIEGAPANNSNGIVRFSTAVLGGSGNSFNRLDNCIIRPSSSGLPYAGIYSDGTATAGLDNNQDTISNCVIHDFFAADANPASGINLSGGTRGNINWVIEGNHFYQSAARNFTSSISGGNNFWVIYIAQSAVNGFEIRNNVIGGSGRDVNMNITGTWTQTSGATVGCNFLGIRLTVANSGSTIVEGNTISNVSLTSNTATTANGGVSITQGAATVRNNLIGSTTAAGSFSVQTAAGGGIQGVLFGTGAATSLVIENNIISGIAATGTGGTYIRAISCTVTAPTALSVTGNTIGSETLANSIFQDSPREFFGIHLTVGNTNGYSITNNLISNININSISSAAQAVGILTSGGGVLNIAGNVVKNINSIAQITASGTASSVIGISNSNSAAGQSISNNRIDSLYFGGTTTAINFIGILSNGSTTGTNVIERNLIHSFALGSTSNNATATGIHLLAGNTSVRNNIIRLGLLPSGNSEPNSNIITGILDESTTANNIHFNTVLIAGTSVSVQTGNSYAYRRTASSGGDNIRNNIFANHRTGGGSGSTHFAFATNTLTGYTAANFDNNIFYSAGNTEFSIAATPAALTGATAALRMQNLRGQTPVGNNLRSGIATLAQINFVNALGNGGNLDLRLNNANCAAGAGIAISGITSDFDGTVTRAAPPAIGAHESTSFNAIATGFDIYTPVITVSSVPTLTAACGSSQTITITANVTDVGLGVATGSLQPTLWWRLSTGTYASLAPVSQSGNTYTYELNLTGITAGQTYHYYVTAQDQESPRNIFYSNFNSTTPVHADVITTASPINAAPSTFTVSAVVPLSGVVTVGSGGDFPSFNLNPGGLFEAINTRGLSGDLEVRVISNINESANWTPLNAHQEFCGTDFTITIRPNAATVYTVEANTSAVNAMFSFIGARRVVIDGSFNGSGRFLRLRHNRTTATYPPATNTLNASTVEYNNGAFNNVLRNCIIEGANANNSNNTTGSVGVIQIGGSMGFANGNLNNITIEGNLIRNLSNVSPALNNSPMNLIYLGGASSGASIKNIIISGNDFTNFLGSAIRADNGSSFSSNSIGDSIWITNNNIYQELTIPTYQYPIVIDALGNSAGHIISGNKIGGSATPNPDITGTWQNNKTDGEVVGIYLNVGNAPTQELATTIAHNTISSINLSGTAWGNFIGIRVERGRVNVRSNTVGSLASSLTSPNITCAGNGGPGLTDNTMVAGIWTQSTEEVVIDSNIICGLATTSGFSFMDGIAHGSNLYFNGLLYNTPGGKATITNNQVLFNRSSSALQNLAIPSPEGFMGIFCWTNQSDNLIANNKVRNCGSGTAIWNRNVRIHGMFVGVYGSTTAQTGTVSANEISHLFNENAGDNTGTINPIVYGLSIANGNWTVANNMIYLNNGTQGGTLITNRNTSLRGLNDGMLFNQANCQARYYNNTVYVSGSNLTGAGPANSTYAFLRFPLDFGSLAITAGAPIELRNNLFINDRSGLGNHRAIGNIANTNANAAVNWSSTTSNHNLLAAASATNVALWGSSTTYTLPNWRTLSGSDAQTYLATAASPSNNTQFSPSDLFVNATGTGVADLRINTLQQACWFVNGKGVAGSQSGNLATDVDGNTRETTFGFGIDIGADEFTPDASVLPHDIIATPSLGGTNTFAFAGRTFATVQWGNTGTVPTSLTARWFTGEQPGTFNAPTYANADYGDFMVELVPAGGSGYEYTPVLFYDDAQLGTYAANESAMPFMKTVATDWIEANTTIINTTNNTLSSSTPYNSFSHFGGGSSYTGPLPITLISFTGKCTGNDVLLEWATALELNNSHFTIERSVDGQNFEPIATVNGAGNSVSARYYTWTDANTNGNLYYYRLKQTDYDGSFEYFNTVAAGCNAQAIQVLLYPNPAEDLVQLQLSTPSSEEFTITVVDVTGKLVSEQVITTVKGVQTFTFDISTWQSGLYHVSLHNASQRFNTRFTKL